MFYVCTPAFLVIFHRFRVADIFDDHRSFTKDFEGMQNQRSNEQSAIPERLYALVRPPGYWRAVACVNGILFLIGASLSIYVYLYFPHPTSVQHLTRTSSSESIESYLFFGPVAQAWLFFGPAYLTLFWQRALRGAAKAEAWLEPTCPIAEATIPMDLTTWFRSYGLWPAYFFLD